MNGERTPRLGHLVLGGLLVIIGALWLVDALSDTDVPWEILLPAALMVVGGALVYGSSSGPHGGLISIGVVLTVLVVLSSAFEVLVDVRFSGGVGERAHKPTGVADLEYRLAIGDLTVDLTAAQPPDQPIEISVGLGQLVVIVPRNAVVEVRAKAGVGEVVVFGTASSGIGPQREETPAGASFVIIAEVGIGKVEVKRG
jgi:hypothetical protein